MCTSQTAVPVADVADDVEMPREPGDLVFYVLKQELPLHTML